MTEHDHHAHTASKVTFGFWTFLMTDCISFAALFATYVVLRSPAYAAAQIQAVVHLITLHTILTQSIVLLVAAFFSGLASLSVHRDEKTKAVFFSLAAFVLGLVFLGMEHSQLANLTQHASDFKPFSGSNFPEYFQQHFWQFSAFASSFFTLLAIHALHVGIGLLWIVILLIQLMQQGTTPTMKTRFTCLSLFWNFINIIWIFIFTLVYLIGAL